MMKAMAAWGPGVLLLLSMLLRRPAGAQEGTPSSAAQGPAAEAGIDIEARVRLVGRTGAEMGALTACAVAALTIYDMAKAIDRGMTVEALRLVRKSGGKSGIWQRPGEP